MEPIPFDKRSGKIWFNGKPINWNDVKIHVLSHGLHYASCVFEGERVYDGEIFKLEEHTERLFHSAKRLGIEIPFSQKIINDSCKDIVAIQKVKNGYVRPVVWRGSEMMAISAQKTKIHVAIAAWDWGSYFDPNLMLKGIKLDISLLIDCKHWKKISGYNLRKIVCKQVERVKKYVEKTESSIALPVIVTLHDERVSFVNKVPIVPITQLSSFLDDVFGNLDYMRTIEKQT